CNDDDPPAVWSESEKRVGGAHQQEVRVRVDREGALPFSQLERCDATTLGEDAGAQNKHVETAERPRALLECRGDRLFLCDVTNGSAICRRVTQRGHGWVHVESADASSAREEGIDTGGSDAGGGTG